MQKRILSVYYSYTGDKEVPQIRLQGKWLKELGFETGKKIVVLADDGVWPRFVILKKESEKSGWRIDGVGTGP